MGGKPYPLTQDALEVPARVEMPRARRIYAPGSTMHVVVRCNNREFLIRESEDFECLLARVREMRRTYGVTLYAYALMANHVHLLLRAPDRDPLGQPLRWLLTETARAFNRARGRRGHFWERRYRAVVVEDDLYALAALRYLDRNPVRAGLVRDPVAYPWSSCAAYALGTPNPLITLHPSYLALSRYARVRQRQYRALLALSAGPASDGRDPRRSSQRAVGSAAFVAQFTPALGRRRSVSVMRQIQAVSAKEVSGTSWQGGRGER
jgi:putative transposase